MRLRMAYHFSAKWCPRLATAGCWKEDYFISKALNPHLKAVVLETSLCKEVAKACRQNFVYGDSSRLKELYAIHGEEPVHVARLLNQSRYKRKQRVSQKIKSVVEIGACLFLTLTFSDETLKQTSAKTRRIYVSRYLKEQSAIYVANVDYGGENGREHYHALILANNVNYEPWHKYGAIKGERVRTSEDDVTRVSKYVAKLSSHAMKVNDGFAPRMIYSREGSAIKQLFEDLF